ncbi:MAG: hypothetical protein HOJ88_11115 [Proteobacteria bacterium]|nr:hypothetical protein [Pseudomonadota bacterium]
MQNVAVGDVSRQLQLLYRYQALSWHERMPGSFVDKEVSGKSLSQRVL